MDLHPATRPDRHAELRAAAVREVAAVLEAAGWAEAVHLAHDLGLINDTDLLGAWHTGVDVLHRLSVRAHA